MVFAQKNFGLHKFILIFIGFITLTFNSFAQLDLQPIQRKNKIKPSIKATEQDSTTLTLPVFDDFSTSLFLPDSSIWMPNGGTTINNTLAIEPPSFNVATFDGADSNGNPYNFINPASSGIADNLTSKLIDLSDFSLNQAILSFYWQAEGLGELPNEEDSLTVQFKRENGNWQTVWSVSGDSVQAFQQEIIPVSSIDFLHDQFQFRFQNYSRLSGSFDTWHVDYIYFFNESSDSVNQRLDIAWGEQPTSLLRRYHDMPLQQFLANPNAELASQVNTTISNLGETFNIVAHECNVTDLISGQRLGSLNTQTTSSNGTQSLVGTSRIGAGETLPLFATVPSSLLNIGDADSLLLETQFLINSNESNVIIPTRNNDTLSVLTTLKDYYAYDDGTAEFGLGVRQRFGQIVYRFELNEPATLESLDIQFIPLGVDQSGQTVNIVVYDQIDTADVDNSVLRLKQNVIVNYPTETNGFVRYPLSSKLSLDAGEFYVGIEQLSNERLSIGYDKNTNSGENIFFNVTSKWEQNTQFEGSLLLRPVIETGETPLGLTDNTFSQIITLHPNPTSNWVQIDGKVSEIKVYNTIGVQILEKSFRLGEAIRLSLEDIPTGLYFVHLSDGKQQAIKKLVVNR